MTFNGTTRTLDVPGRFPSAGTEEWICQAPGRWWVVHTRARNEKAIAERLALQRVLYYLPLVAVQHTYAKSRATFMVPLFPGYLFLCGDYADCDVAWGTNRVANILDVEDQDQLRTELVHVCRVIESGQAVELYPSLQMGQRCRVTEGPLRYTEGVVIGRGRRCRLFLSVTMLGQSAVVEIDAALLEAID